MTARCSSSKTTVSGMAAGCSVRGGRGGPGYRPRLRPRARAVREARARSPLTRTALCGDQPGGLGAGELKLIGEEAVEALGRGGADQEAKGLRAGDGGLGGGEGTAVLTPLSAIRASTDCETSSPPACRASSRQREMASAMAPQLTAMSATLKVGQRWTPTPTSRKSTTPCGLRIRSIRLPSGAAADQGPAPAAGSGRRAGVLQRHPVEQRPPRPAPRRGRSSGSRDPRGARRRRPELYTRRSWNQSPRTGRPGGAEQDAPRRPSW